MPMISEFWPSGVRESPSDCDVNNASVCQKLSHKESKSDLKSHSSVLFRVSYPVDLPYPLKGHKRGIPHLDSLANFDGMYSAYYVAHSDISCLLYDAL